jgi:hypothetical protein
MSSFSFSWDSTPQGWPARLGAWNPRSENYRVPVPCKHGNNCLFTGVCSFVHPGEEGTGLKYFPGRAYLAEDGTQCWESAVVRLIGRPSYYERRRMRHSWSDWCFRVGLPEPSRYAPSGRRQERLDLASALPAYSTLVAAEAAYQKQQLGNALFLLIEQNLASTAADRETAGYTGPLFTAGKFTGMFIQSCSGEHLFQLVQGGAGSEGLCTLMLEACEVLSAAQKEAAEQHEPHQDLRRQAMMNAHAAAH